LDILPGAVYLIVMCYFKKQYHSINKKSSYVWQ